MAEQSEVLRPFIVPNQSVDQADGFVSLIDGMNGGVDSTLLPASQYAFGTNVSSRGGKLKTRPRFRRLAKYIPPGIFQGAAVYRKDNVDRIIFCVDGVVYSLNLDTLVRYRVGAFPTATFSRAYFCQADQYFVIQNGITYPTENWPFLLAGDYIFNNADVQVFGDAGWTYLGDAANYDATRVPIGTCMAYGHGRLFVASPRVWDAGQISGSAHWVYDTSRRSFLAGNIVQADNRTEIFAFIESTYLSEGGALEAPATIGGIYGLTFYRNAATGTGLGTLVVFGSDGVAAFAVNSPRDQWKDIDLAQVMFLGNGSDSTASLVNVNDDVGYRSQDGFRFLRYTSDAAAGQSGGLSNLPQSFEVQPVIDLDSRLERLFVSSALCDNRLLYTAAGRQLGQEIVFDALVSLDVAVAGQATLGTKAKVAYDGIYTGLDFLQVLSARMDYQERHFAFVKMNGRNELWYLDNSDSVYLDNSTSPTKCRMRTRSYPFNNPTRLKEFKYVDVWLTDIQGDATLTAYWRSDGYQLWNACTSHTLSACVDRAGALPQRRFRLRLVPDSVTTYDAVTGRDVRMGYDFQFELEWTGMLTVEKVQFKTLMASADATPELGCDAETCVPLIEGDGGGTIDEYDYDIPDPGALAADADETMLTLGREPLFYWTATSVVDGFEIGTVTIVGPTSGGTLTVTAGNFGTPNFSDDDDAMGSTLPQLRATEYRYGNVTTNPIVPVRTQTIPALPAGATVTVPAAVPVGNSGLTYAWGAPNGTPGTTTSAVSSSGGGPVLPYVWFEATPSSQAHVVRAKGYTSEWQSVKLNLYSNLQPTDGTSTYAYGRFLVKDDSAPLPAGVTIEWAIDVDGVKQTTTLPFVTGLQTMPPEVGYTDVKGWGGPETGGPEITIFCRFSIAADATISMGETFEINYSVEGYSTEADSIEGDTSAEE